jgi:hypothetical protein
MRCSELRKLSRAGPRAGLRLTSGVVAIHVSGFVAGCRGSKSLILFSLDREAPEISMVCRRWRRCRSADSCGVAVASIFPPHRAPARALADFDFPHGHCRSRTRVRVIPPGCRNGIGECSGVRNRIQFHLVRRLGPACLACIVARRHNNLTSAAVISGWITRPDRSGFRGRGGLAMNSGLRCR